MEISKITFMEKGVQMKQYLTLENKANKKQVIDV